MFLRRKKRVVRFINITDDSELDSEDLFQRHDKKFDKNVDKNVDKTNVSWFRRYFNCLKFRF